MSNLSYKQNFTWQERQQDCERRVKGKNGPHSSPEIKLRSPAGNQLFGFLSKHTFLLVLYHLSPPLSLSIPPIHPELLRLLSAITQIMSTNGICRVPRLPQLRRPSSQAPFFRRFYHQHKSLAQCDPSVPTFLSLSSHFPSSPSPNLSPRSAPPFACIHLSSSPSFPSSRPLDRSSVHIWLNQRATRRK